MNVVKTEKQHQPLMERFATAFVAGDIDAVILCLAPQFEWHLPDGKVFKGHKAVRFALEQRLKSTSAPQFTNVNFCYHDGTIIQTYDVGVKGADNELRYTRGLDVYRISDGLISRKDAYWKFFD